MECNPQGDPPAPHKPHTPEFDALVEKALAIGLDDMDPVDLERLSELLEGEYDQAVEEKNSGRAIGLVLMRAGIKANNVKAA